MATALRRVAEKLVRGDASRRTRLHTARGDLIPASAWPAVPKACWRRARGKADGPWFVPTATRALAELLTPAWNVLELGAGRSTPWLAARAGFVTTFEDDAGWAATVRRDLETAGLAGRVALHVHPPGDFARAVRSLPDQSLDLVVVDCAASADRVACTTAAATKVRPGGFLLLDDSDRREYVPVEGVLADWPVRRFAGLKDQALVASETSLYRRPEMTP
jgi:hypothetical protein